MLRLMHETGEALDSLGIDYDRRPAAPHVTLLRNARSFHTNLRIDPPIDWSVQAIALYSSSRDDAGPVYLRVDPSP